MVLLCFFFSEGVASSRQDKKTFCKNIRCKIVWSHFENRILLKPVLGRVASIASFIDAYKRTELYRVSYCRFLEIFFFFASKGSKYADVFISIGVKCRVAPLSGPSISL